ncbi:hypothetical protein CPB83DRAFT_862589 [Crepidotus variabilis]|uniref:Methyltransferase n=1 Tax=Crepidotus variabilis TaxID=179855 RepID=A0A9P6JK76_9AGAR|nr:hypothetical protein CPB83DRAFT_862589 [Crepidotus variabilis]
MATAEPSEVKAVLHYSLFPEGERAFQNTFIDPTTGERKTNITREAKDVIIENVRGKEHTVSLDTTGFQFFKAPSKHKSFANDEEIKREYYPESIELIKKLTGASRVVLFDHTIRRHTPGEIETPAHTHRQPALAAHVDQSVKAAVARVHRHLPADEASELVKKRFQIINLWRPISHPAYDHPLALCDYRSVDPEKDIFPVEFVYPDKVGETLAVKYSENYKWKYLRGMTPDEIVLIKCADSVQDGSVSVFTPHTAFKDPSTPRDAPLRQSIELRTLVFYD